MTQITIKIELSGLDKAMTEVKAVEAYILELAKTYPTTFKQPSEEVKTAPKTVKRAKKVSEPVEEVKEVKEPSKPKEEPTPKDISLADLTTLAKATVATAGRDAVKDLVASFSTTAKLSDVPTEKFSELVEALKAL